MTPDGAMIGDGRPGSVGTDYLAPEVIARVSGRVAYTGEVRLPGMLHGRILRSPHPHALIRAIDTSAAEAIPGVIAVVTAADMAGARNAYGTRIKDQPVLADGKVRYQGDLVAAVAAESDRIALAALAAIEVAYEPLPPVMTIEDALAEGAPTLFDSPSQALLRKHGRFGKGEAEPARNILYRFTHSFGDVAAGLARADHVFDDTFHFSRMTPYSLEPYVVVARANASQAEIWSCNQDPFLVRQEVAAVFDLAENAVRVNTALVGAGFGGRSYCKVEPLAVLMARKAGRPVRLLLTMDEGFVTLSQHAGVLTLRTGVTAHGELVARESLIRLDAGAYADASPLVADKTGYRLPGPYRWDALHTVVEAVRTSTIPAGSFRGFGGTQANFAAESQLDMIARRLGIDPVELRRRNLLPPGEPYLQSDTPMDSDIAVGLERAVQIAGYRPAEPGETETPPSGPRRGIGFAIGFKDGGGEARAARASVKATTRGDVLVRGGAVDMGQGLATALCQIAAAELRIAPSRVRWIAPDTDHAPFDQGTHASCGISVMGTAVQRAARDLRNQVLAFAADELALPVEELGFEDWQITRGNERYDVAELAANYFSGYGGEFEGRGDFKFREDLDTALASKRLFWMPSWIAIEVEVDPETGCYRVINLIAGTDAGKVISPTAARGQVEGGAMQALGQAMFEHIAYDGDMLATGTPLSYRVPLAADIPETVTPFLEEHGLGPGPFGSKGIGESTIIGVAAALANAIEDAVGVRITELPIRPEAILDALSQR